MKKIILTLVLATVCMANPALVKAQSLSSLKSALSKVVSSITGSSSSVDMTGTWNYTGSAVSFESDNILLSAGGSVASSTVESQIDEQLSKLGIKEGSVSFTFSSDSTFTSTVGSKTVSGSYSYDSSAEQVTLTMAKVAKLNADVSISSSTMELLFDSDKLMTLVSYVASVSNNSTLSTISSLLDSYDGMQIGLQLEKE